MPPSLRKQESRDTCLRRVQRQPDTCHSPNSTYLKVELIGVVAWTAAVNENRDGRAISGMAPVRRHHQMHGIQLARKPETLGRALPPGRQALHWHSLTSVMGSQGRCLRDRQHSPGLVQKGRRWWCVVLLSRTSETVATALTVRRPSMAAATSSARINASPTRTPCKPAVR